MDEESVNHKILHHLRQNARMANAELADRLQTTPDKVAELIDGMEADGTIMGYYALVNEEKLGKPHVRAVIEVEVQPERDGGFDRIARTVSRFAEVHAVYLVSGRYDLRLEILGETLQEVAHFVASKLAPLDGVKATVTHFLLKKYKEAGFQLDEDEQFERLQVVP